MASSQYQENGSSAEAASAHAAPGTASPGPEARDLNESPHCYKRLAEVLAAQGSTIRVLHTLTPVGVAMAGADEFDPYKG